MSDSIQIVFMIFTGLIFLSVFIQLIMIAGMGIAVMKMQKKVSVLVEELRVHALPMVKTSREMMDEYSPKVKVAIGNFVEASGKVRSTTNEVSETVKVITTRARGYAAQADEAITGTLDRLTKAGNSVQQGISGPMRQINGVINGLRAGLNVICNRPPARPGNGEARPYTS